MASHKSLRFYPVKLRTMRLKLSDVSPEMLEKTLPTWADFFKGEKVVLDLSNASPLPLIMDWAHFQQLFAQAQIDILGVCGVNKTDLPQLKNTNLLILDDILDKTETKSHPKPPEELLESESISPANEAPIESAGNLVLPNNANLAHLVQAPVRSGVEIYHPDDVVVLGRVNAGAQILAGGNIFICGALRGKALAGGVDNKKARIFTASMQAELVCIAGVFQKFENGIDEKFYAKPVSIALESENGRDRLKIELL